MNSMTFEHLTEDEKDALSEALLCTLHRDAKCGGIEIRRGVMLGRIAVTLTPKSRIVAKMRERVINYDLSIAELLASYDHVDGGLIDANLDANLRMCGIGSRELNFATFSANCAVTSEEMLDIMRSEHHRPASHKELLAFGDRRKDLQRNYPVVSLDPILRDDGPPDFIVLGGSGFSRRVEIHRPGCEDGEDKWPSHCRFLGVCIRGA